jgi:hypothetical protein
MAKLSTEDYIAIQQLYARYNIAFDLHDLDTWVGCYVEGGELAFAHGTTSKMPSEREDVDTSGEPARRVIGHDNIRALGVAALSRPESKGYHWNSNLLITPTESGAAGQCYLMFIRSPDGLGSVYMALNYTDELVKVGDEWLFKRRLIRALPFDYAPVN